MITVAGEDDWQSIQIRIGKLSILVHWQAKNQKQNAWKEVAVMWG